MASSFPVLIDTSKIQYAPWRTYLESVTPNPEYAPLGFRPPDWAEGKIGTYIQDADGNAYYFDGVMRVDHNQARRVTEHPIQSGANITDHSFQLPARVTMEIAMSDVMDCYITDQFGNDESYPTKSVQAYQKILEWQKNGEVLVLSTRLEDYVNMVIDSIAVPDDFRTRYGLKGMVTFKEIIVVDISIEKTTNIKVAGQKTLGAKDVKDLTNASVLSEVQIQIPGLNKVIEALSAFLRTS